MAVISLGLPFPALTLGSPPAITHSHEILPLLAEGKGCFHSWNAHWPQRCYTLTTGGVFSGFLTCPGQGGEALTPTVIYHNGKSG